MANLNPKSIRRESVVASKNSPRSNPPERKQENKQQKATPATGQAPDLAAAAGGLCYFEVEGVIMVFNPDFNFGDVVSKRSNNEDVHIGGSTVAAPARAPAANASTSTSTSTSWFESDSESPANDKKHRMPLAKIEERPSNANPKNPSSSSSSGPSMSPPVPPRSSSKRMSTTSSSSSSASDSHSHSHSRSRQPKPIRKVSPFPKRTSATEPPKPPQLQQLQQLQTNSANSVNNANNTNNNAKNNLLLTELLLSNSNSNSSLNSKAGSKDGTSRFRHRPASAAAPVYDKEQQKKILSSIINPKKYPSPYSSTNSSSSTIKPVVPSPVPSPLEQVPVINYTTSANPRKIRPKLQLRTASEDNTAAPVGTDSAVVYAPPIPPKSSERRIPSAGKEQARSTETPAPSPPPASAVSHLTPESDTSRHAGTAQQVRIGTKLPLQSLLLSPLGAKRNRLSANLKSPQGGSSSSSSGTDTPNNSNMNSACSSRSGPTQTEELDKEEAEELADMVSTTQLVGPASGRDSQPGGPSSRPVSRFRRFSLAYLSGSEHDYDGGSEHSSSRSPLRSWRSWSNRSSIVSFSSSNNRLSRNRYSAVSIATTSQGTSSSSSAASNSGLEQHHSNPESVDDPRRPSLSCSSVAELSWKQVPPQTYAHLMSSRRNSVVTATTRTQQWQYSQTLTQTYTATATTLTAPEPIKEDTPSVKSAKSEHSDTSSVHSLNERVYTVETPLLEREDPFTAFYNATRPKAAHIASQETETVREAEKQEKEKKVLRRIANGGFFDSEDDSESDGDLFVNSNAAEWWMSGIEEVPEEEEEWEIPRVPSLEFDTPTNRVSSISTGTTLTSDELHPSTPTAAEIAHYRKITEMAMTGKQEKRRSRRRTASSECLIMMDAVEGLRTMYLEDTPDECAVDEDEDGGVLGSKRNTAILPLEPVRRLSLLAVPNRSSRRL
ncbi:hypothetical protein H072_5308 [Dactylellina haptotyla CBS 200.50]|uniref:Uncharacterized protein n=1 Tax=Dactylellina haptotyla (strain CBS 200.50) TaxID=1284197 RepID=S8BZJ6_DACHA|nr:hypothetical protein H072_5308 [Dactylellina haptotyla CBS 200.50]